MKLRKIYSYYFKEESQSWFNLLNFLEIQRLDYDQIKLPKLIVKCILKVLYYSKVYKIFPKKEVQIKVKNDFDFLVNLNTNKEIYFDLEQQILIKKFANN